MSEHWEDELLLEAEVLGRLNHLFEIFTNELAEILITHEDDIDHRLAVCLGVILQESCLVQEDVIKLEKVDILGIQKQLADTLDEINVLQAGKMAKTGCPFEDVDRNKPTP